MLAARRYGPALVHLQYAPVAFRWRRAIHLLPILARMLLGNVPVVVTAHEFGQWPYRPPLIPGRLWSAVERQAARRGWFDGETLALVARADRVIVTNRQHAERIRAASPGVGSRLEVIPIGPNVEPPCEPTPAARAEARRRWELPDDAPVVVFFGFLHPVKGLEYLLRAFSSVRGEHPSARLIVAGGWESLALPGAEGEAYRDRLLRLVAELELDACARVTGYLGDGGISALLFAADVVALPFTFGASFKSGTLLAAMAHGAAVVSTRAAEPDPDLREGEHLLCVPPRDAGSLTEALFTLLANPGRRASLAQAGRAAASRCAWPAIAEAHRVLYDDVLAGGRHATPGGASATETPMGRGARSPAPHRTSRGGE